MPVEHKKRSNVQLCYPFSEDRLLNRGRLRSNWGPPYIYQHKLNGERCRALVESTRVLLFSSTDEFITTLPHINEFMSNFPQGEYDGEIYKHGWSFSRIHSAVSTFTHIHPDAAHLEYHLFDCITTPSEPQGDRLMRLSNCISQAKQRIKLTHVIQIPSFVVYDISEIMKFYDHSIADGYEGFVLKDLHAPYIKKSPNAYRSPYWMKFKPKQQDIYPIIGIEEAISKDGQPLEMVGAFKCQDEEGNTFKVGAGKLTHVQRKALWELHTEDPNNFKGAELLIEYQTMSDSKGVPHFSRAVKLI